MQEYERYATASFKENGVVTSTSNYGGTDFCFAVYIIRLSFNGNFDPNDHSYHFNEGQANEVTVQMGASTGSGNNWIVGCWATYEDVFLTVNVMENSGDPWYVLWDIYCLPFFQ